MDNPTIEERIEKIDRDLTAIFNEIARLNNLLTPLVLKMSSRLFIA